MRINACLSRFTSGATLCQPLDDQHCGTTISFKTRAQRRDHRSNLFCIFSADSMFFAAISEESISIQPGGVIIWDIAPINPGGTLQYRTRGLYCSNPRILHVSLRPYLSRFLGPCDSIGLNTNFVAKQL